MIIAINTRFLLPAKMEGFGWFTYEVVKRLVENHPEHTFLFFFDRKYDSKFIFAKNIIPIVLNPPARHPFLYIIWFEIAVYKALKKYKADVFFSPDGYLSLRSAVKQIPVFHDLNFEHYPQDLPFLVRKYYQYFFPKFARKASHIITVSNFSKNDIVSKYEVFPQNITVAHNGCSEKFVPIDFHVQEEIRSFYSSSKEYYLFVGALHPRKNVKRLLQAYILLLQQGKTTKNLVIVGENMWKGKFGLDFEISAEIKSHIHFTGHLSLDKLTKVVASAFAFVFVPYFEGFGIPLLEAMQAGTPCVSGSLTSLPEVGGDAVLYVDPFDVNDISAKMLQLENDSELRNQLIQKGLIQARKFSWDKSAETIWKQIHEML